MATAGPNLTQTVTEEPGPGEGWVNLNNAKTKDGNVASVTVYDYSNYILFTGFGFDIPLDATIDGIEVRVRGRSTSPDDVNATFTGYAKGVWDHNPISPFPVFTNVLAEHVIGGPTEKAGLTWTPAEINSGFLFYTRFGNNTGMPADGEIDWVEATVYFTEAEGGGGGSSRRASSKMLKGV